MPYVPSTVAVPPVETSQDHLRRALQLLEELEDQLRAPGFSIPARYEQVGLLAAARRRLGLAGAALQAPQDPPRSSARLRSLARKRASLGMVVLAPAGWVARALAFVLRFVWRSMRAFLRLAYMLRAIWP